MPTFTPIDSSNSLEHALAKIPNSAWVLIAFVLFYNMLRVLLRPSW